MNFNEFKHLTPSKPTNNTPSRRKKESIRLYLEHVQHGRSLRSLARETGFHASTVMRQIRKIEDQRDDPLIDNYIERIEHCDSTPDSHNLSKIGKNNKQMNTSKKEAEKNQHEEYRILRRMCERGTFLGIGRGLKKGVIFRKSKNDSPEKIAVIDVKVAENMVLKEWIKLTKNATINIYHVTDIGRAALRQHLSGSADIAEQHREWGNRNIHDSTTNKSRTIRVNLRESPLGALARRQDAHGKPFLTKELINAGERLREDFELSQIGCRVAQNWDRFITGGDRGQFMELGETGSSAARDRFQTAFNALGAGLADIAVRCCCFLEGLETAEKHMGWSARSGKIVLRIALERLKVHYEEQAKFGGDYIG